LFSTIRKTVRRLFRVSLLPGFAALVLVGAWVGVSYQIGIERTAAHNEGVAHSQSLAHTLSEHVGHMLRQGEHATQLFKLKFEETGGRLTLADFARHGGLLDSVLPRLNLPVARFDRSGALADRANGFAQKSAAKEAWFGALAGAGQDLAIFTTPVLDARSGQWVIEAARRLNDRAGNFDGAVVLQIDPMFFIDDYDRLNIDDRGMLLLMSSVNGMSLGRIGERIFSGDQIEFTRPSDPGAPTAEVTPRLPPDGVARIYSVRDLPRYPLQAYIGIPRDIAFERYERHRRVTLWLTTIASLIIVAVTAALMRQSQRLRASMREAREAQTTLRAAADGSFDGFVVMEAAYGADGAVTDFVINDLNARAAAMMDLPREQIMGRGVFEVLPHYRDTGLLQSFHGVMVSGQPREEELELVVPGLPKRWIRQQIVPIPRGVAVTTRDITQRKEVELQILDHRSFLQSLIDHLPLLICVRSMRAEMPGEIVVWNGAAEDITGFQADQVVGRTAATAFPDGFGLFDPDDDQRMERENRVIDAERPLLRSNGSVRQLYIMSMPLFDGAGAVEYVLCIAEDFTVRRAQEQQLRANAAALQESEARLRTIADTLPAMVAFIDADQVYRFINSAYDREFGSRSIIEGRTILDTIGPARYSRLRSYIERALAGETVIFEETEDRDGTERTLEVTYIPQRSADGASVIGFHVMRQDITAQKHEKKQLLRLAQVDALTGMLNRAGFMQKLDEAMTHSAQSGKLMALMYLDIDRFKPVNDTYGHGVGDALLKAFAGRLAHSVRSSDTIARLGGDEFTIVMENVHRPEDAAAIAAKIVANMRGQFVLDGVKVTISTSIGLAFYEGGDLSAPALIEQADMMLYKAKQGGRDTYRAAA